MKGAALVLLAVTCVLAVAQIRPSSPDTVSRSEVVLAAKQALDGASRNLGRWLTLIIIVVLATTAIIIWRVWGLSRHVARLEDLRSAWDTRFAATADEVLRLKRKLADAEGRAGKLEADMAALRPAEPDAATAQVAIVQSELVAIRERLDRAEGSLEAVADHTVVTSQERAVVESLVKDAAAERARIEGLVKAAGEEKVKVADLVRAIGAERQKVAGLLESASRAQSGAEAAAARAETIARRAAAVDLLRAADDQLAQQQYPAAVQTYTLGLDSLEGGPSAEPGLQFHALHNRALANLRQREYSRVLDDATRLDRVGSDRARGASRLLSGIARLWQGDVAHAIKDFADATAKDANARAAILQDNDIVSWIKVNSNKAAPLKRYLQELSGSAKHPHR